MYKEVLLLFFIGHFLADYYFQSDELAKKENKTTTLKHCFIYAGVMIAVILPVFSLKLLFIALIISIVHLLIDFLKYFSREKKHFKNDQNVALYLFDQALHLITILIAGLFLKYTQTKIDLLPFLRRVGQIIPLNIEHTLAWILILLFVSKPASITIRIILNNFEPQHKQKEDVGIQNAGALIGIFERLIILFMLYVNEYAAIGFVLTAKSVARYNKISENPQFAEYYLLGTLLSSLIIMVAFYLIF